MIKVESMDAVHCRSGVIKAGKATVQPGRWAGAATARSGPYGVVVPVSSGGRPPYHQSGNPCSSFPWRCFIDCFIHENGYDDAVVIALARLGLCGGRRAQVRSVGETKHPWQGRKPSRGWRPRQAFRLMPSRGEVPRQGRNPWRGVTRHGEALSPGLESLIFSEMSLKSVVGLGRPARGTLVFTVPTENTNKCLTIFLYSSTNLHGYSALTFRKK